MTPQLINKDFHDKIYSIVEISKGSRVKYEYNEEFRMVEYDRILETSMSYPGNYGFIPNTMGGDYDPIDIIFFNEYPILPNTLIETKIVGVLEMIDGGLEDYKLIGVPAINKTVNDLEDIPEKFLALTKHFFKNYKIVNGGEKVWVGDWFCKEKAMEVLHRGARN